MKIYVTFRSGLLQGDVCRVLLQVHLLTGAPSQARCTRVRKENSYRIILMKVDNNALANARHHLD
jgi:hypothetical protein